MSTSNVQNTGATQTPSGMTAAQQKSAALKDLAAKVSGGDTTGIGQLQGALRTYQGHNYVAKPSWKPSMIFDKTAATAYKNQLAVFKEQRVDKHFDRVLDCMQMKIPNVQVLERSLKFLDKFATAKSQGGITAMCREYLPAIRGSQPQKRLQAFKELKDHYTNLRAKLGGPLKGGADMALRYVNAYFDTAIRAINTHTTVEAAKSADPGASTRLAQARTTGQTAIAQQTLQDRQTEVKQFQKTAVADWVDPALNNWSISADGASGVILVNDKRSGQLQGVLKFDNSAKAVTAKGIGSILAHVHANSPKPLSLDFPLQRIVDASEHGSPAELKVVSDLTNRLADKKTAETDARKQFKCDLYADNVADTGEFFMYTPVRGQSYGKMPLADRVAIFNSDGFPQDLAHLGVLGPFLGLNDHCGLIRGNTNLSNLMLGDNGRMTIVDFEGQAAKVVGSAGDVVPGFGFPSQDIVDGFSKLMTQLTKVVEGRESIKTITGRARMNDATVGYVQAGVERVFLEGSDNGLFNETNGIFNGGISDTEQEQMVAKFIKELPAAFAELRSLAPHLVAAHQNNPTSTLHANVQSTLNQVFAMIDAFDQSQPGGGLNALANLPLPTASTRTATTATAAATTASTPTTTTPTPTTAPTTTATAQGVVLPPLPHTPDDSSKFV